MANIKSKQKAILSNEKANIRNSAVKSSVKTAIKKAKIAAVNKDPKAAEFQANAHHEIDKAVSKGVLHQNNGSRKASRLDAFIAKNNN
ncbi:30S ribosomal protein S20 [Metamycoplasma hominis]|uniref:Small ribosomal subunit protein bS20 n=2 Tax=Metamycoplasma hominis TaxID=2098 RepID=D1J7N8_METH1|nr:30S ribosomal protein S20 [Metamycoplasma hominis]AIU33855.1 30S ribosomal protein S20 [Metamycoplasma hominis ATCC 27545]AKJ52379.1 30S ribosomal protein S20 [Metamycoplasma hominis]AUW36948.1 30S ribosomal protein S20 [Metamycoplasma hominis]AYK04462.1 30S ribosomal protein S20 [Metamycoplasma hominis]AYN65226.1 30S ribosomal protein S20 [Metamycoplasma hominis]